MFEQVILSGNSKGRRAWTTVAGFIGQASCVAVAVLAPLLWPEALPKIQAMVVTATLPQPDPPPTQSRIVKPRAPVAPRPVMDVSRLTQPKVPLHIDPSEDAPPISPSIGVSDKGNRAGDPNGVPDILIGPPSRLTLPVVVKPLAPKPDPKLEPATRVRIGGDVLPPHLLRQVQPPYPPMAKTTHTSGVVELSGVIGTDGKVRELKVLSGHPFLTKSALDAVAQWTYEPTKLNGQTVEVVTRITVTFRLD